MDLRVDCRSAWGRRGTVEGRSLQTLMLLGAGVGIGVLSLVAALRPGGERVEAEDGVARVESPVASPSFRDVTAQVGLAFLHRHGGTGERYLPETNAGGIAFLDYDGDGDLDIYCIQSGTIPIDPGQELGNALYRNDGGKLTDVSRDSGLADNGYGSGVACADYDNDGDIDVYVTNFGPNRLYRNRGDGTFEDVTEASGTGDPQWASSAAFADYDADGRVDLYVVNYVDFTIATHQRCTRKQGGAHAYCHPDKYAGVDDVLYRNRGDGSFEDVTRTALPGPVDPTSGRWLSGRMDGKGLGVVWTDVDNDGDSDIYVANDATRNFLFLNTGDGRFEDGLAAGVGYNEDGKTEGSMGVDSGDVNGDGWFDLFTVHLDGETNTLYINGGDGTFSDSTNTAGLGSPSIGRLGFGTNIFDYDSDGDQDIFVANGHVLDNIELFDPDGEYAQMDQIFRNDGQGRFEEVSHRSGEYFERRMVGRASAIGDFDNDGDIDIVISNCNGPAVLLLNDGAGGNHSVLFRLIGTKSNRDGIGALVRLTAGGRTQVDEVRSGASYQAQSDLRLHFGLGKATRVDEVIIEWPGGGRETLEDLPADHLFSVEEGKGITARKKLEKLGP